MAQSLSDEEIQLRGKARRRLVGAIALVLLVSAVLPMVLDSKPKPAGTQDIAIDIPKQDDSGFASRVVPTVPQSTTPPVAEAPKPPVAAAAEKPAEAAEKPVAKPADKPAEKPVEKAPVMPVEKPAAKETPKTPEKAAEKAPAKAVEKKPAEAPKAAKTDKEAKPQAGAYVVQLGAFSNAENAKQLQAKLSANHIKAYTDTLKTASGERTRVRAGPYASREEADKALAKIKQLGLDGKVVPK